MVVWLPGFTCLVSIGAIAVPSRSYAELLKLFSPPARQHVGARPTRCQRAADCGARRAGGQTINIPLRRKTPNKVSPLETKRSLPRKTPNTASPPGQTTVLSRPARPSSRCQLRAGTRRDRRRGEAHCGSLRSPSAIHESWTSPPPARDPCPWTATGTGLVATKGCPRAATASPSRFGGLRAAGLPTGGL